MASNIITKLLLDDKDYTNKLNKAKANTNSFEKSLSKGLTSSLTKVAGAIGIATSAVGAFNTMLKNNEGMADAWHRTMDQCRASVDYFFTSLSTGSFDGFTQGLKDTIKAAGDLYNALDALGTFRAYKIGDNAELQYQLQKYQTILRNANATDSSGNRVYSDVQIKEAQAGLKDTMEKLGKQTVTEIGLIDSALMARIDLIMKTTGSTWQEAERMLTQFGSAEQIQAAMNSLSSQYRIGTTQTFTTGTGATQTVGGYAWTNAEAEKQYNAYARLLAKASEDGSILDFQSQKAERFGLLTSLEQMRNSALRATTRSNNAISTGTSVSYGGMRKSPVTVGGGASLPGATAMDLGMPGALANPIDMQTMAENHIIGNMAREMDEMVKKTEEWGVAASSVGGAFEAIGDAIGGNTGNMVAWMGQTMTSLASLLEMEWAQAILQGASVPFPANIAAIATTVGTLISAISAFPKFAAGGVVPGSNFNDGIMARVSSGEVVLNKDQQNILSRRLDGAGSGRVEFVIRDSQLVGILNNYNRKAAQRY